MEYRELCDKTVNEKLIRIILSKPVNASEASKVRIRPVKIGGELKYQAVSNVGSKESNTCREIHENMSEAEAKKYLMQAIPGRFKQGLFECGDSGYTVMAGKKGNITIIRNKTVSGKQEALEHNHTKKYLLAEGEPVPFLTDLGVMTDDGRVVKAKYDKFRQINRYLEFVDDIAGKFDADRELTIIDFGCGKSYLTFALYYYLNIKKGLKANIIGLDLKPDVIAECSRLAKKYRYERLKFIEGDIEHFEGVTHVDMVITLHACDTATDYAIYKAIKWDADVIMAVPCCQHELNKKIDVKELEGITGYGILKDRLSAIITDAMRANALKESGYDTQILEFIDMEHTPKNLLIRAVKSGRMLTKNEAGAGKRLKEFIGTGVKINELLGEENPERKA